MRTSHPPLKPPGFMSFISRNKEIKPFLPTATPPRMLEYVNRKLGLQITEHSAETRWSGESMDYNMGTQALSETSWY